MLLLSEGKSSSLWREGSFSSRTLLLYEGNSSSLRREGFFFSRGILLLFEGKKGCFLTDRFRRQEVAPKNTDPRGRVRGFRRRNLEGASQGHPLYDLENLENSEKKVFWELRNLEIPELGEISEKSLPVTYLGLGNLEEFPL